MQLSNSKYIEVESVGLAELFKREPGAYGIYLPAKDADGKVQTSLAKIAAQAKTLAVKTGKRCVTQTLWVMEPCVEGDMSAPIRILKVTVTPHGEYSERGKRYKASQSEGLDQ